MTRFLKVLVFFVASSLYSLTMYAQRMAVKTNALYWTTATFNAGFETRLSSKWTLDVSAVWNPFTFSDNKKLKHVVVQPEARYWLCAPYSGHFIGANILYSHYNAGGVKVPFGIFPDLETQRFQGDLGAVGIVYGYSWMLPGKRWSFEGAIALRITQSMPAPCVSVSWARTPRASSCQQNWQYPLCTI